MQLKKINVKIHVSHDEDGTVLLNGFGPKSQMGKAYRMALHAVLEEEMMEVDRYAWLSKRSQEKANAINDLITSIFD